jgi:multicomponent Na+:H+ antiporter subunit F
VTTVTTICLALLAAAGFLSLLRLARGDSLPNRIVALDALLLVAVSGIAVGAVRTSRGAFVDALVLAALLGFISTVAVAGFMDRRGPRP